MDFNVFNRHLAFKTNTQDFKFFKFDSSHRIVRHCDLDMSFPKFLLNYFFKKLSCCFLIIFSTKHNKFNSYSIIQIFYNSISSLIIFARCYRFCYTTFMLETSCLQSQVKVYNFSKQKKEIGCGCGCDVAGDDDGS